VRRVSDIVAEISAASAEQSTGIGQVNQAIVQMDGVTQQNAALVEEAAAAAESLQHQAATLVALVGEFKVENDVPAQPATRPQIAKATPARLAIQAA
jgi:methyl-accepting chemotaxis protein